MKKVTPIAMDVKNIYLNPELKIWYERRKEFAK